MNEQIENTDEVQSSIPQQGIEIEVEILENGDVLLSRDHKVAVDLAKLLNPDEEAVMMCFLENKPEDIDGRENFKSFCG